MTENAKTVLNTIDELISYNGFEPMYVSDLLHKATECADDAMDLVMSGRNTTAGESVDGKPLQFEYCGLRTCDVRSELKSEDDYRDFINTIIDYNDPLSAIDVTAELSLTPVSGKSTESGTTAVITGVAIRDLHHVVDIDVVPLITSIDLASGSNKKPRGLCATMDLIASSAQYQMTVTLKAIILAVRQLMAVGDLDEDDAIYFRVLPTDANLADDSMWIIPMGMDMRTEKVATISTIDGLTDGRPSTTIVRKAYPATIFGTVMSDRRSIESTLGSTVDKLIAGKETEIAASMENKADNMDYFRSAIIENARNYLNQRGLNTNHANTII